MGGKTKLDVIETYGRVSTHWNQSYWTAKVTNSRGANMMERDRDELQAISSLYLRLRRIVARDIQNYEEFTGGQV